MTPMKENVATRTAAQHSMKKMWAPSAIEVGGHVCHMQVVKVTRKESKFKELYIAV